MKRAFAIAACYCVAMIQVLAGSQHQQIARNYIKKVSSPQAMISSEASILRKRGSMFSKNRGKTEDPQARIARLRKMTPTTATLNDIHTVPGYERGEPSSSHPSAAKMTSVGPKTFVWSRTHDGRELQRPAAPGRDQRQSIAVNHRHGSLVVGKSGSKKSYIKSSVEGRRVEGRIETGKDSHARMEFDLEGQKYQGYIGPGTKAQIAFRHPSPTKKFSMTSRLHGKGSLVTQGQAHFGSQDVTPNDTRTLPDRFNSQELEPPDY
ncbi:MAG: hypothetical protein GOMPHAMPRED_006022 [Gomphillus americanus]|uniref:Secreted protein n=1 Tax=Gomphillus americanus TaxID=1940652 RepID=A0A8H3ES48_9LECA|nr:MAG: hypothetical protein GOMPHAMPRED_006022 [Gomphillus americanus]